MFFFFPFLNKGKTENYGLNKLNTKCQRLIKISKLKYLIWRFPKRNSLLHNFSYSLLVDNPSVKFELQIKNLSMMGNIKLRG